jgi:RNA polymerase sigma-70 factor (ECF subfamily)
VNGPPRSSDPRSSDTAGIAAAEAFVRALYDDVAGPLFGYALRLTGDRNRAEEVVQETLVRAWRRAAELDLAPDALRAWLFTVARNLVTDLRRSDAARPATVSDEFALSTACAADELDRAVQSWTIADALTRLTPEHRAVLVETYYEGRSVVEAAQRLGIPAGTVKSRTYYALRALRLALEEMGETR